MVQKSKKTKNQTTFGKRQRRELRRQQKARKRALIIGALFLGALALGAYAFLPRPAVGPLTEARLADDPHKGSGAAPMTIIEFGDFGCPSCKAWHEAGIFAQILDNYEGQVRIVWRDFPVITSQSPKAAEAAQCAYDQDRFWDYHDLLFERAPRLNTSSLKEYAVELGLDGEAFNQCLDSGLHAATVDRDLRAAYQLGLRGTPSFLVNDRPLVGANPGQMVQMIESFLGPQ